MKNKKGLTLVELIVSIALISIVMVFMFQLLTELRYQDASDTGKVEYKVAATILTKEIQNILLEEQIDTLTSCDTTNSCLMITFIGGNTLELSVSNENQVLNIIKKDASDNILIKDVRQIPEKDETGYLGKYDDFGYSTKYFDPVNGSYDYKYDSLMKIELNLYDSLNNVYPVIIYYPYTGGTNFSSFSYHTLTVVTDGGTWSGTSPQTVAGGESVTINNPIKTSYLFTGWTISGTGSSMDGTTFTMGTEDTTITANWVLNELTLTVNAAGGTWSGITPQTIISSTSVTIANPTKAGYVFTGWTVSGTGSSIDGTTFTMGTADTTITANWLAYSSMFTYTVGGNPGVAGTDYEVIDDTNNNWRIKFYTSGIFIPIINMQIEAFLVGGGGGGGVYNGNNFAGGGGGGGYTNTFGIISLTAAAQYTITIGAGGGSSSGGGSTSAFGYGVNGGSAGGTSVGGAGGSGGGASGFQIAGANGGTNGGAGYSLYSDSQINYGGLGQGITTREFNEATGALYSGGGGGGGSTRSAAGLGGAGGGANGGGGAYYVNGDSAAANTGGGGGGASSWGVGGSGGSGIVVIRNATTSYQVGSTNIYRFSYTGRLAIINQNTENWKIKFLTGGTFTPLSSMTIDAFLVGGGGGGAGGQSAGGNWAGSGAGGGYTKNISSISLTSGTNYLIVVGSGGAGGNVDSAGSTGGTTAAFSYSSAGGAGGNYAGNGGAGGSGGGAAPFQAAGVYGGTNGGPGSDITDGVGTRSGGTGQGTTTYEFANSSNTLYAGGGGSGGATRMAGGIGGAGGGADGGGGSRAVVGSYAQLNTGGGGGGGSATGGRGGRGGSGVVVIKKS